MFSSIQNTDKNHGAFQYVWSDTAVITGSANPITGAWVPTSANPDGSINVTVSGLAFSGSLEINTDVLELINASGVRFNASISGQLSAATKSDLPSGYTPFTGMVSVGRSVVTSGYNPQYQSGQAAVAAFDNVNGGQLAVMSDLDRSQDSVVAYPPNATTASNYVPSGNLGTTLVTGIAILADPNRIAWGIQVIGSGSPLYVKFGTAPASTGSFNLLLRAASADWAADGGSFIDSPAVYLGDVSISGSTRFTCWSM